MAAFPSLSDAMKSFVPAHTKRKDNTRVASLPLHGVSQRPGTHGVLAAFGKDPFLFSAIGWIADAASDAQWRVAKGVKPSLYRGPKEKRKSFEPELIELPTHELAQLLERPGTLSQRQTFRTMVLHSILVGEVFLFVTRDDSGTPTGFFPVPPSSVQQVPSVGQPYFYVSYQSIQGAFDSQSIVWLKTSPNPLDPLGRGVGVGHALADLLSAAEAMETTVRATFQRGGAPTGIIGVEAAGDDPQALGDLQDRIQAEFTGASNAGKVLVASAKVSGYAMPTNFRDLTANDLLNEARESLRKALRLPAEILGDASSSTRAATEAAQNHAFDHAVKPQLEALRAEMQDKLAPLFDASALIEYDLESPRATDLAMQLMTNPVTANLFTEGEVRRTAGFTQPSPTDNRRVMPAPGQKPLLENVEPKRNNNEQ